MFKQLINTSVKVNKLMLVIASILALFMSFFIVITLGGDIRAADGDVIPEDKLPKCVFPQVEGCEIVLSNTDIAGNNYVTSPEHHFEIGDQGGTLNMRCGAGDTRNIAGSVIVTITHADGSTTTQDISSCNDHGRGKDPYGRHEDKGGLAKEEISIEVKAGDKIVIEATRDNDKKGRLITDYTLACQGCNVKAVDTGRYHIATNWWRDQNKPQNNGLSFACKLTPDATTKNVGIFDADSFSEHTDRIRITLLKEQDDGTWIQIDDTTQTTVDTKNNRYENSTFNNLEIGASYMVLYDGIRGNNYVGCGYDTDDPEEEEEPPDVEIEIDFIGCPSPGIFLKTFRLVRSDGTTPDVVIRVNGTDEKRSQSDKSKPLLDFTDYDFTDPASITELKNDISSLSVSILGYDVGATLPEPLTFEMPDGTTILGTPLITISADLETKLNTIIADHETNMSDYNALSAADKAKASEPVICEPWEPPDPGCIGACGPPPGDTCPENMDPKAPGTSFKSWFNATEKPKEDLQEIPVSISFGIKGDPATAYESSDSHPIYEDYECGTADSPQTCQRIIGYTHGNGSHVHKPAGEDYIQKDGKSVSFIVDIQPIKEIKFNEAQFAQMLTTNVWKGHTSDTEHFLASAHKDGPLTIDVSYNEPDLLDSDRTANEPREHTKSGDVGDFEGEASGNYNPSTKYTYTFNYEVKRIGGPDVGGGTFPGLNHHFDQTLGGGSGAAQYAWYVAKWTVTLKQEMVIKWQSWEVDINTAHNALSVNDSYRPRSRTITKSWDFDGEFCFHTRTLLISEPTCKAETNIHNAHTTKNFDPSSVRGGGRQNMSVFEVGKPSSRTRLTFNNPNVFAIQTTSGGQPGGPRAGPGQNWPNIQSMPYYTGPLTHHAQPTYSFGAGSVYSPTSYFNRSPFDASNPGASATSGVPSNVARIPAGGSNSVYEPESTVYEPGQYTTTWTSKWTTDANPGWGWLGDEFFWEPCANGSTFSANSYVYAEPPTCKVNDYIIHEHYGKNLDTITVTLTNPNDVPMPLGVAQIIIDSPTPGIFPTEPLSGGAAALVIPKRSVNNGQLTLRLKTGNIPAGASYGSTYPTAHYITSKADPASSKSSYSDYVQVFQNQLQGYSFATQVANVTRSLGEHDYRPHIAAFIGNEDFTTSSPQMNSWSIQDSWFEQGSPNEERVKGDGGSFSCSKSDVNKVRIARRPYLKFFYGGTAVGGEFSNNVAHTCSSVASADAHGFVIAHADEDAGEIGGSSSELNIQAKNNIFGFYTASLRETSDPNPPLLGLTLNNQGSRPPASPFKYYGGDYGGRGICIPHYWGYVDDLIGDSKHDLSLPDDSTKYNPANPNPTPTPSNPPLPDGLPAPLLDTTTSTVTNTLDIWNVSQLVEHRDGVCYDDVTNPTNPTAIDLNKSTCENYDHDGDPTTPNVELDWIPQHKGHMYYYQGDISLTNSSPTKDLGSLKTTIFIDGDLYIKDNILNNREYVWKHPTQIGYLLFVVRGNIYIDPSVDTIDALLVALLDSNNTEPTGEIWTCMEFNGAGESLYEQYPDGFEGLANWRHCGGTGQTKKLVINGALVANVIHFNRIVDTVNDPSSVHPNEVSSCKKNNCRDASSSANKASEEINLVPEYFLASPAFPTIEDWMNAPDAFSELPLNF